MKQGPHLNSQGVHNGKADGNNGGDIFDADHEHMDSDHMSSEHMHQGEFGQPGNNESANFAGGQANNQANNQASNLGRNQAGNQGSNQAIGGLFPEGMDPSLFASLNLDGQSSSSGEEGKPAFDDLLKLCRGQICPVCPTCKEAEEAQLRALADLDNTKKRLLREKDEQTAYVSEKILNDIIPALDNLHLALQHAPHDEGSKNFVVGVEMTLKLLLDTLGQHGLEEVGRIGEAFDPAIHEAVGMNDIPEIPDNHISALLSRGYRLKGRLLRPAKVMVCKHTR